MPSGFKNGIPFNLGRKHPNRKHYANGITLCEECHSKTDNYKGRNIGKRKLN